MSEPDEWACGQCGAHHSESRKWLVRIYRAVQIATPGNAIHLPKLAEDVERLVTRLKSFEDTQ